MPYDEKQAELFAQWAHDEGLSKTAAQNMYNKIMAANVENFKAFDAGQQKAKAEADATRARDLDAVRTALRTQWGQAYDSRMPRNMAALQNPMMIPATVAQRLDQSGILRDPAFHLWWDRQVSMMSSDRKLGLKGEEGDGLEEETPAADGHLPKGFFKNTEKRHPARKKAS
jgi:hypothetical protein